MQFSVTLANGERIEFECADNAVSRRVNEDILRGRTYAFLPFVPDVRVVLDVGANCGATTVHFAHHYPDAQVHSFEPGSIARGYLERNTASLPNVHVHPIGLYSNDAEVPLYVGDGDIGMASIFQREVNLEASELVKLRDGGAWASENGVTHVDVLKVDVEGAEVEVLTSLQAFLPGVKVLYLEYDSRHARRAIEEMMAPTHELYVGSMFLDQGEVSYLRRDLADDPEATETLRRLLAAAFREGR